MKVPDRDDPAVEHDFLVSFPPRFEKASPFGRSTQPSFVYDVELGKVVFMKTYWRDITDGQDKEGDIYQILSSKKVRYLPVFGKGNDVRAYLTRTPSVQQQRDRSWGFKTRRLETYRLYRMSLETIGRKLTEFRSVREMVLAIRDAMCCHDDAFFKANILHRDISPANIMINTEDGSGFLIDWDLCLNLNNEGTQPRSRRVGTWQFMAAHRLRTPQEPHTLADDRESALWVLTWVSLLYAPHSSQQPLRHWLSMFTERMQDDDGPAQGGNAKAKFTQTEEFGKTVFFKNNPGLCPLIMLLQRTFSCRYILADSNSEAMRLIKAAMGIRLTVDPEVLEGCEDLLKEGTLLNIFDAFLDLPHLWSTKNDPAILHPDAAQRTHGKRSASDADLSNDASNERSRSGPKLSADTPARSRTRRRRGKGKGRQKVGTVPDRTLGRAESVDPLHRPRLQVPPQLPSWTGKWKAKPNNTLGHPNTIAPRRSTRRRQ